MDRPGFGQATFLANHFRFIQEDGTKVVLRDADAKKRKHRPARLSLVSGRQKRKLELASPDSIISLLATPSVHLQVPACARKQGSGHSCFGHKAQLFTPSASHNAPMRKRRRVSHKDFVDRENASFHTHWRASRDLRSQPAPPPASVADRFQATRGRVLAKKGICSGE